IQYTNVNNATNTDTLTGTVGDDLFTVDEVASATEVSISGVAFFDVTTIDGGAGTDSVSAQVGSVNGGLNRINGLVDGSITLSSIEAAVSTSGVAEGTSGIDTFVVTSSGGTVTVVVGSNTFINPTSIDGLGDSDTIQLDVGGSDLSNFDPELLVAAGFQIFGAIDVLNVESLDNSGTLTGTSGIDSFTEIGINQISANSITFSDVTNVIGNTGADTVNLLSSSNSALSGSGFDASISGINYLNIENVNNTVLVTGTISDEIFTLTGNNLEVNGITFNSIMSLDAGVGDDTVDIENQNIDLTIGLEVSGVALSGVEIIDDINQLTSANGETLTLSGTTLTSSVFTGVDFNNASSVVGDDSQVLTLDSQNVDLDSIGEFDVGTIAFTDIGTVTNTGQLTGSTSDEAFSLNGTSATVDTLSGTTFNDVASLVGGSGTDAVDIGNVSNVNLIASGFSTGSVSVTDVDTVTQSGSLTITGTTGGDSFSQSGANQVTVNGALFSSVNSVEGNGGNDSVDLNNDDAAINAASDFTSNGIQYTNVNNA
ncbi:beta strand repeat-containing protein, partial [Sessilibacter corallicola]|uniref:beta strand repeat-containing protein n=1 Tax=Sessilibacter corallicola TaxID=2904075 RepID=UPI00333E9B53